MANGAAAVARLDNWFWTSTPTGDALIGKIFDDPPPRSWPDGASTRTSNVSELEQQGAVEGKIILTVTGRRYLLVKAATHASLAAERDDAQREADELREQLEALQAAHTAPVLLLGSRGTSAHEGAHPREMPHLRKSLYTWLTCAH